MISVVIPSCNRRDILNKVLGSYLSEELVTEVIIVNDSIGQDYDDYRDNRVKVIKTSGRIGAPAARNIGMRVAKNDLIFFGEDDAYISSCHLTVLLNLIIENPNNIYSGILCDMKPGEMPFEIELRTSSLPILDVSKYFDYRLFRISTNYTLKEDLIVPFTHALFLLDRNNYKNVFFYENYSKVIGYREETDLQASIKRLGGEIIVSKNAYVYHMSRADVSSGGQRTTKLKFLIYSSIDNAKFFFRHKDVLFEDRLLTAAIQSILFPFRLILNTLKRNAK